MKNEPFVMSLSRIQILPKEDNKNYPLTRALSIQYFCIHCPFMFALFYMQYQQTFVTVTGKNIWVSKHLAERLTLKKMRVLYKKN
ncbi:hypothetical protein XENTR_v10008021 [Xenopus tropicalis]|nr:hypothetical protein XENTR_v10008021 [Xenopus tropicalis]KAE8614167.1 hypothetical protein XENTR_v10008021 [Xenopus tropicalis]